jgi:hypothetical protein
MRHNPSLRRNGDSVQQIRPKPVLKGRYSEVPMSMNRELNPQLFGPSPAEKSAGAPDPAWPMPAASPAPLKDEPTGTFMVSGGGRLAYQPLEMKALEHQVSTLKVALQQAEKRSDSYVARLEELTRMVHGRMERFSQAFKHLEESQQQHNQEVTARFAQMAAKVSERKVMDNKIQELVDRHNMIIRNFEARMGSLQRVVSEQELSLHNAQAAIEEARAELSKRRG